jgi:hypothetical protein
VHFATEVYPKQRAILNTAWSLFSSEKRAPRAYILLALLVLRRPSREKSMAKSKKKGPQTAAGKARIAACASISTPKRWAEVKSSGQARLGPITENGLASLREFNTGRKHSPEACAKNERGSSPGPASKKIKGYQKILAESGIMLASVLIAPPESKDGGCHDRR